ncbi:MAG: MFS transporter [Pseudomonadales bacterium]
MPLRAIFYSPLTAKVLSLFFLGFAAGIPILLIFSTLSLWLNEAGVSKSEVTYFSWAALGYSFKFIWAPIVDKLPLPLLTKAFGRRRGWLLLSQTAVVFSILLMSSIDPIYGLSAMAFAAVLLGFSSATQDIVIDSYRIECATEEEQRIIASSYISGYRIGMLVAGAGGLFLAEYFGSTSSEYLYPAWQKAYWAMAIIMLIGVITTLCVSEPDINEDNDVYAYSTADYVRFFLVFLLSIAVLVVVYRIFPFAGNSESTLINSLIGLLKLSVSISAGIATSFICSNLGITNKNMVKESYLDPIGDFFYRYGKLAIWILLLIGFYRVSDIVMGVVANLFYQDMGYTKTEIASVTKVFGVLMTITGAFAGGFIALKIGTMRTLLIGAVLASLSNLVFSWLSLSGNNTIEALTMAIAIDNLSAGVAVSAFVAWLSSLTSVSFPATQYAIFSSVMTLFPKVFGGYSGTMVEFAGYSQFFVFTALLGIPIIILILALSRRLETKS